MRVRAVVTVMGAALAALALLAGGNKARAADEGGLRKFVFATDWKAEAEQGGFYQALATGLYAKHGLDVVLRQGGIGMDPQQLLAAGAIDGAIGSNGFFPLNLIEAGADVVSVAALFQKDPFILMSHPEANIATLADMKGKPIMLGAPSVNGIWRWIAKRYGFQDAQIRKYTFNLAPFLVDKGAIQQGYVTSEPYTAQKAGVTPKVFLLADNGWLSYGELIMVRGPVLRERPQVVKAFVEATIEGWYSYLYGDPSPGNALIKKDNPDMDDATLAFAVKAMRDYGVIDSGEAKTRGIGAMSPERWQAFVEQVKGLGLYKADLDWRRGVDFSLVNQGHGLPTGGAAH